MLYDYEFEEVRNRYFELRKQLEDNINLLTKYGVSVDRVKRTLNEHDKTIDNLYTRISIGIKYDPTKIEDATDFIISMLAIIDKDI